MTLLTATVQHGSSSILRRLGGADLMAEGEPLPRYYDPEYHCEMEMLRFDSRKPNPRYAAFIADVKAAIRMVPIFLSGNVPLQAAV